MRGKLRHCENPAAAAACANRPGLADSARMKQARCRNDNCVGSAWITHGLQVVKGVDKTVCWGRTDWESRPCPKTVEQLDTAHAASVKSLGFNVTCY